MGLKREEVINIKKENNSDDIGSCKLGNRKCRDMR